MIVFSLLAEGVICSFVVFVLLAVFFPCEGIDLWEPKDWKHCFPNIWRHIQLTTRIRLTSAWIFLFSKENPEIQRFVEKSPIFLKIYCNSKQVKKIKVSRKQLSSCFEPFRQSLNAWVLQTAFRQAKHIHINVAADVLQLNDWSIATLNSIIICRLCKKVTSRSYQKTYHKWKCYFLHFSK